MVCKLHSLGLVQSLPDWRHLQPLIPVISLSWVLKLSSQNTDHVTPLVKASAESPEFTEGSPNALQSLGLIPTPFFHLISPFSSTPEAHRITLCSLNQGGSFREPAFAQTRVTASNILFLSSWGSET